MRMAIQSTPNREIEAKPDVLDDLGPVADGEQGQDAGEKIDTAAAKKSRRYRTRSRTASLNVFRAIT